MRGSSTVSIMEYLRRNAGVNLSFSSCARIDLTDILYQRDWEIIAFEWPDLAVSGTDSLSVVRVVDIHVMSAV